MKTIETTGYFNEKGEIKLDISPGLKNKKVKILIVFDEEENENWHLNSLDGLSRAYGDEEPEYDLSTLKESNTLYQP